MAVEAKHLNLLQLFNPMDYTLHASSTNMYGNIIHGNADNKNLGLMQARLVPSTGTSTTVDNNNNTDRILPYYTNNHHHRTFAAGGPLQHMAGAPFHHQPSQQTLLKDDSGITFNNNAVPPVSRKRSRDNSALLNNSTTTTTTTTPVPPPLLPLSTVAATADARKKSFYGSTNIRGCGGTCSGGSDWYSFLDQDLSIQMMQYELELDRFISVQMEKVRLEMEQRRRKQSTKIISAIEEALVSRLRDRDSEIDKMGRLNSALEEKIKSLCLENQFWRDLAQTNEATANGLRSNLEQLLASQQLNNKQAGLEESAAGASAAAPGDIEDVASCCGSSAAHEQGGEDEVNTTTTTTQQLRWRKVPTKAADTGGDRRLEGGFKEAVPFAGRGKNRCRKCGKGESSVLLLPCRHLCVCATCGPTVDNCPICNFFKEGSVHVYLS